MFKIQRLSWEKASGIICNTLTWKWSNINTENHHLILSISNFGLKISSSVSVFKSSYCICHILLQTCNTPSFPPFSSLSSSFSVTHTSTIIASLCWEEVFVQRAVGWPALCYCCREQEQRRSWQWSWMEVWGQAEQLHCRDRSHIQAGRSFHTDPGIV